MKGLNPESLGGIHPNEGTTDSVDPMEDAEIKQDGEDSDRADSGLNSDGTMPEDELQSNGNNEDEKHHGDNYPITKVDTPTSKTRYTKVVEVHLDGRMIQVKLVVKRDAFTKPFLGGYRNKTTGCEYHNAAIQANVPNKGSTHIQATHLSNRNTQTLAPCSRGQQTTAEKSVQVVHGLNGLYTSSTNDRIIYSRNYITAEESVELLVQKVIVIQKYWRGYMGRMTANLLRQQKQSDDQKVSQRLEREKLQSAPFLEQLITRNPQTTEDIEHMRSCIEKWRNARTECIFNTKDGQERLEALQEVIEQETQMLAMLEHYRRRMFRARTEKRIDNLLHKMSESQSWSGSSDKSLRATTNSALWMRRLRDVYHHLRVQQTSVDARVRVLNELQDAVRQTSSPLAIEILSLAHRELVLIAKGSSPQQLSYQRQRLLLLFLQFIFNPTQQAINKSNKALKHRRSHTAPGTRDVASCASCGRSRPTSDFIWTAGPKTIGRCWICRRLGKPENSANVEPGAFRHILHVLRKQEEQLGCTEGMAFVIQEDEIRYLVQNIWHQQSALSGVNYAYDLNLCRWRPEQPWSPWNCVLLTEDETRAHYKLASPDEMYGPIFVQKVRHRNMMGRRYFSQAPQSKKFLEKDPPTVTTSLYITVKPAAML